MPVKNQLVVALLRGSNTKEDHCVTIFDNWIFNSNFDWALPLSKELLDLCCSSDETNGTFVAVREARLCRYADVLDSKPMNPHAKKSRKRKKH